MRRQCKATTGLSSETLILFVLIGMKLILAHREVIAEELMEMEYQVNNWYHFTWASGDQICEQHIHNLDIGCWIKGMYPVKANGYGAAKCVWAETVNSLSQIFDHTFVEYTFEDGTKMYSYARHLKGGWSNVSESVHGTKGTCDVLSEHYHSRVTQFASGVPEADTTKSKRISSGNFAQG